MKSQNLDARRAEGVEESCSHLSGAEYEYVFAHSVPEPRFAQSLLPSAGA